jgi:diguanylate cyclase (GGDEF)-like protein/PAS domain S-box-containing protein
MNGGAGRRPSGSIQIRLSQKRKLLARLMRSDALTRGDVSAALHELTELAAELLRVERASVWRLDQSRQTLECVDLFRVSENVHSAGVTVPRAQAPSYFDALATERCIAAEDAYQDPRTRDFSTYYLGAYGIGAMLDAPIFVGGSMVGVVCHEHVGGPRRWEFWEELVAGTLADFVALVIEAHERVRVGRQLGMYKHHLAELSELRSTEARRLQAELGWDDEGQKGPPSQPEARRMFDASPVSLLVSELESGVVLYANRRAASLFDLTSEAFVGKSFYEYFLNPEERSMVSAALDSRGRLDNAVLRLRTSKNWPFWALLSAQRTAFEGRDCIISALSDITAQKVAEAAVRRSEESVRTLFAAAPVAMVLTDFREAQVLMANQRAADLFEVPLEETVGLRTYDFYVNDADRDEMVRRATAEGKLDGFVTKMRTRTGKEIWALMSAHVIEFGGEPALITGITDITAQKELEAQLRQAATHDFLTQTYNRRGFLELGEAEVQRSRRSGAALSLCTFDVDHFKALNDTHGHAVGDEALRAVAAAAKRTLRTPDIFARFGGEEFILLYPDTGLAGAVTVTARVRAAIAKERVVGAGGEKIGVTVSAGVAELRPGESLDGLIRRADDALYEAKTGGRDRVVVAK